MKWCASHFNLLCGVLGVCAGRMPVDKQAALQVADQLEQVLALQATSHQDAVASLGRNCHLPNSCQTPLHAVLHYEQRWQQQLQQQGAVAGDGDNGQRTRQLKQQLVTDAVRDALAAGGCCASRASFVGACMGALLGVEAVPAGWLQKYEAIDAVQQWASTVCEARST